MEETLAGFGRVRAFFTPVQSGYGKTATYLTLGLRVLLGWVFLWAGAEKLYAYLTTGKLATPGYLQFATRGPLAGFFQGLAGNMVVEVLIVGGLILIGLALILGVLVRVAAVSGIVMMLLMYVSAFPPEHNPLVDDHIVYAALLGLLAVLGAGRFLGVDQWIEKRRFVEARPRLKLLLG